MASRKGEVKRTRDVVVIEPPSAPARRRRRSQSPARRRSPRKRRSRSGGGGQSAYGKQLTGMALGGYIFGYLEKHYPNMPTVPVLGKSGTVAIASYFLHGHHPYVRDVGRAAAAIAGYTFGSTGSVAGDVIARQL